MNLAKLVDVCEFQGGTQPPKDEWVTSPQNGFIRMLQIRDFTRTRDVKEEYVKVSKRLKLCNEDDILIARYGASVGKILTGLKGAYNVAIIKTIPNLEVLHKRYLYYYLLSPIFQLYIRNVGDRAAQAGFNKEDLFDLLIPLPPLEIQKKLVAVLDKAQELIDKRKEQMQKLDEFVQSVFLELFGDPVNNPKHWDKANLEQVADIVSGVTKGRKLNTDNLVSVPYMRVANVQDGHLVLNEIKKIEVLDTEVEKYHLEYGDLLMTEGGDPDKLGRCAIWKDEVPNCIHQNHIFRVRLNSKMLLSEYLCFLTGSTYGKKYFLRAAKQTTGIATINSKQLKGFPVLIPSLDLQRRFSKIVEKAELQKLLMQQSLTEMENNFNSIMQRAFKGELFR